MREISDNTKHVVETLNWYESGPMISFIDGEIELEKAQSILLTDKEVLEIIHDAIEFGAIEDEEEITIKQICIGPMKPEYDGEVALHLDDEGNNFWEECEPEREGSKIVTGISWEDWFV